VEPPGKDSMRRCLHIAVCVWVVALPATGLGTAAPLCDEGIRALPQHDCASCCCAPAVCKCEVAPAPQQPAPAPASAALVAPAAAAPSWYFLTFAGLEPSRAAVASGSYLGVPFHPENRLERLHVLQV